MTMLETIQSAEEQVFQLSPHERGRLADRLIASLDDLSAAEHEQMWVEEAAARYEAYKRGELTARPVEEVLRDARAALQ